MPKVKARIDLYWIIAFLSYKIGEWLYSVYLWACRRYCHKLGGQFVPDVEQYFCGYLRGVKATDIESKSRLDAIGIWLSSLPY